MIPFFDLHREYKAIENDIQEVLKRVLEKADFIMGTEVSAFEKEWSTYLDVQHTISVASGTDALYLTMKALNIQKGDEVIVPAFTFVATAFAVSLCGGTPVFADVDPDTYTLDPKAVEKKITKRTKAIIPVHIYGNPADMHPLMEIAEKHNIVVVEDAAQAQGAMYDKKKIGGIGHIGCFSFYPSKNLGAYGDAGAIVTNDDVLAKKLFLLKNYGQEQKYYSKSIGVNSRIDEVQAAILRIKLRHLDEWNKMRSQIVKKYDKSFSSLPLRIQKDTNLGKSCHYVYTLLVNDRKRFMETLKNNDVATLIHYPVPLHLQECYKSLGYKKGDFPVTEKIADMTVSIPLFPFLSEEEQNAVIKQVNAYFKS